MINVRMMDPPLAGLGEEELEALGLECVPLVDQMAEILMGEMDRKLSRSGPPLPGEPPAEVSGELRRSLTRKPAKRRGKFRIEAEVGSEGVDFAGRQEFGGVDERGRVLPPHPWARPAEFAAADPIDAMLQREIEDAPPVA